MTIETLTETRHGLAGLDTRRLCAMRKAAIRNCFKLMEDTASRIDFVATVRGRSYYNDAASRNVNATWYTLEELQGGLIWITCPGQGVDYSRLLAVAKRKVRMILVLGDAAPLRDAFSAVVPHIVECPTMAFALKKAHYYDSPDVNVVFSPATFDEALPTQQLADEFKHEVNEL